MMHKKSGFILIFSLVMLSLITLLTEHLIRSVYFGSRFMHTMKQREHAKMAALSGINLALAQLSEHDYTLEIEQAANPTPPTTQPAAATNDKKWAVTQKFLERILPHLNRWQVFDLEKKRDGAALSVQICISCENGKINVNEIFDFQTQTMRQETGDLLRRLAMPGVLADGVIYTKLQEFFMARKKPIHDISELCEIEAFKKLDIFYKPPERVVKKNEKSTTYVANIALQDLFTVWNSGQLDAMMLSEALLALCSFRRPSADDAEKMSDKFKQVVASFDPELYKNTDELLRILEPVHQQKGRVPDVLKALFSKRFEPTVYSVLSYGKVGNVEQRLLAVVKRVADKDRSTQAAGNQQVSTATNVQNGSTVNNQPDEKKPMFRVVRLYWL